MKLSLVALSLIAFMFVMYTGFRIEAQKVQEDSFIPPTPSQLGAQIPHSQ